MLNSLESAFGELRPRLLDGPAALRRHGQALSLVLLIIAAFSPVPWLLKMDGRIGEGAHAIAIVSVAIAALPFVLTLGLLAIRSMRLKARGMALSDRDLDRVVEYAHRLGISQQAREKARNCSESLAYPAIDNFLDWLEQQSMMLRVQRP